MTLNEIISAFEKADIENPLYDALAIASHFTGKSNAFLLCDKTSPLTEDEEIIAKLECAVNERISRRPLQYILGEWEFMGLNFRVSEDCLIPRSDTEVLCESAIKLLPENGTFLDLCTGSGCIAISVAHYRPDAKVTALEKYPQTIKVAKENCERILGSADKIRFVEADVTSHTSALGNFGGKKFDFIASNPPYVTAAEMNTLAPELSSEPRHALTDEGDGLSIIKEICRIYPMFLRAGGTLAIEHSSTQGEAVRRIMSEFGHSSPVTLRDVSGNERVTMITMENHTK